MLYSYIYIYLYIYEVCIHKKRKHPEFPNRQSVFFQICPCRWCLTETLILTVILIEKIKLGSFALQQPCSCVKSHSPVLWDKNLHQWESKSSSGVRLLHSKIRNHKSQIKVPKGKKITSLLKKKNQNRRTPPNHWFPNNRGLRVSMMRFGVTQGDPKAGLRWWCWVWVGGEGRPATGPKNKKGVFVQQNKPGG